MMRKIRDWLAGWYRTLAIMFFERELYRHLREPMEPGDFAEVHRPHKGWRDEPDIPRFGADEVG